MDSLSPSPWSIITIIPGELLFPNAVESSNWGNYCSKEVLIALFFLLGSEEKDGRLKEVKLSKIVWLAYGRMVQKCHQSFYDFFVTELATKKIALVEVKVQWKNVDALWKLFFFLRDWQKNAKEGKWKFMDRLMSDATFSGWITSSFNDLKIREMLIFWILFLYFSLIFFLFFIFFCVHLASIWLKCRKRKICNSNEKFCFWVAHNLLIEITLLRI